MKQWLQTLLKFEPLWMLSNLLIYGILVSLVEGFLNVTWRHKKAVFQTLGSALNSMGAFEFCHVHGVYQVYPKKIWSVSFFLKKYCIYYQSQIFDLTL